MQAQSNITSGTIQGTVSGTALTVIANLGSQDIIKTVLLAGLGAVVSFCVTVGLKWLKKKLSDW
jgi:hypothetical protein